MRLILALCVGFLVASTVSGQGNRKQRLLETEKHVVDVELIGDDVVFRMEAITDLTNDRDSTKPLGAGWDYAGMRIDINNNNLVDEKIDIAFGTRQKTHIFCPQYIINEGASTGCGVLPSKGRVKVDFVSSSLQKEPHPVFIYRIPLSEIKSEGGKIGLVFRFSDPNTGRSVYPSSRHFLSFKETIQLELSELK